MDPKPTDSPLLTPAAEFRDVSRGNPKPHTLKGEALVKARLTPESWRLEVVSDGSAEVAKPRKLDDSTALDLPALLELGKGHGVKFLKAMQCLNIAQPLGHGLWEGVPLRELIMLLGKINNVRRIYYWGFHNDDPKQLFQSSLSYTQVMETPPGDLPPFVAYRLNGEPLSLERGGPVRMLVPWAHGFKSIKWLHRIVLTNDFKANDTYADANNDPESHLKNAAYLEDDPTKFAVGKTVFLHGTAIVGLSGLKRVEYWLRPDIGMHGTLDEDDPAWKTAKWQPCRIDPPPNDWSVVLPRGVEPKEVSGFDPMTGKPKDWPLRYSAIRWTASLDGLMPGMYEFRARTVDLNDFAQPEPRPYQKTGRNLIQVKVFEVTK
jgi:DMSO/TMAO reductase YedYZ molybdopterin-dependent catalytic subunit